MSDEVERRVLELRRAGKSYAKIAARLGISASLARSVTSHAVQEFITDAQGIHGHHVLIETERLKVVTTAVYRQIMNDDAGPNPQTVETYLRASKQLLDISTPK